MAHPHHRRSRACARSLPRLVRRPRRHSRGRRRGRVGRICAPLPRLGRVVRAPGKRVARAPPGFQRRRSLDLRAGAAGAGLGLQRYGQAITVRIAASVARGAGQVVAAVGASLDAIYRSPGRVAASLGLHIGGWIGNALVAWMAFRLIGSRIELASVVAIESLVAAARSVGVLVPNALGVQEAAYTVLTPLFGAGAELGLAVSLLKRARDIVLGVPVLLVWQAIEGRRAVAGAAGAESDESLG